MASDTTVTLRLILEPPHGGDRDLLITAGRGLPARTVVEAIAQHLSLPPASYAATCLRSGQALDDRPLESIGLLQGDRVSLTRRSQGNAAVRGTALVDLAIIEPGRTERLVPLGEGDWTFGRDPARATVILSDEHVSAAHAVIEVRSTATTITDLRSTNHTYLDGRELPPRQPTALVSGSKLKLGKTKIVIRLRSTAAPVSTRPDGLLPFNRPPRVITPADVPKLSIPAPPAEPAKGRIPIATSVIPLVLTVAVFAIAPNTSPAFLLFALLSPAIAIASYWEGRWTGRGDFAVAEAKFKAQVTATQSDAASLRERETERRRKVLPDLAALRARVGREAPGLWERRGDDSDFLRLRVGVVDATAETQIQVESGGSDRLHAWAASTVGPTGWLSKIPLAIDLCEGGSVGIVGPEKLVGELARWLVLQAVVLHSPRELSVSAVMGPGGATEWSWLAWLPHTQPAACPLRVPALAPARNAAPLLADVRRLRSERVGRTLARQGATAKQRPWLLLVLDGQVPSDRASLSSILAAGTDAGIASIWLGQRLEDLPGDCRIVVEIGADRVARVSYTSTGVATAAIAMDQATAAVAREVAVALAPVVDVTAEAGMSGLPDEIGLLDLLEAPQRSLVDWLDSRWQEPQDSIAAPIGVANSGALRLDFERNGPHGLVAGTSGSGKSELLQTMVGAMAAVHPPTRVTFLLIDYKGGTAFRECSELPHTVGYVTDLDPSLTTRALISLNAELRRREAVLAASDVKDIHALQRDKPQLAFPSLCIVVDEYATLYTELPDFVSGLVDVAQRGRALGVHLVLGTQSPGGVVGQAIRANIGFRIALRTADGGESSDVIGADVASRISPEQPGRAYVRFGSADPVLFQTAHAGARRQSDPTTAILVRDLDPFQTAVQALPPAPTGTSSSTDLAAIAEAARSVAAARQLPPPHRPWLPPLPSFVSLADLQAEGQGVAIGLVDEPEHQQQTPALLDLDSQGGLVVYGVSGSGKTTLLRTAVVALASRCDANSLRFYGLDFGAGGLRPLEALPHCGAVVPGDDLERAIRLLRMVQGAIVSRRAELARRGITFVDSQKASEPGKGIPRLLVLIDGYEGFVGAFERVAYGEWTDVLPKLVADGRSAGVYFLVSAGRRFATPSSLVAALERRIVLRQAEADDYSAFGLRLPPGRRLDLPPGRGFTENGHDIQCAVVSSGIDSDQTQAIRRIAEAAKRAPDVAAVPSIGRMPSDLAADSLPARLDDGSWVIGIGDEWLEPVGPRPVDGHFMIGGPGRSGRSTVLRVLARAIREGEPGTTIHLLAASDASGVESPHPWEVVAQGPDACQEYVAAKRWEEVTTTAAQLVLMIDDAHEILDSLNAPELLQLMRRRPESGVWVVATVESDTARRAYSEWLLRLRRGGHGLLLSPDVDVDGDLLNVRLPRFSSVPRATGRGYLVRRNGVELVQVAHI